MPNKVFSKARKNKNDEFYTQLYDIENELKHYVPHFKDKTVYCNCDDPEYSNFYFFFKEQFQWYGLKKLITTHYEKDKNKQSFKIEITCKNKQLQELKIPLKENGDFRSQECVELLKESDVVVTNPPFSLFREYVKQLIDYNKKFLIIGPLASPAYKEIFKLFKENKIWLGYGFKSGASKFVDCNNIKLEPKIIKEMIDKKQNLKPFGNIHWFTNLEHSKRYDELILWETYSPKKYPKYYNYDAINVDKTVEIPKDYDGLMGVPITFLDKYNPNQFEIIGLQTYNRDHQINANQKLEILKNGERTGKFTTNDALYIPYIKSKKPAQYIDKNNNLYLSVYARIIIKSKKGGK